MPDPQTTTEQLINHRLELIKLKASLSASGCAGSAANLDTDIAECNRLLEMAIKNEDYLARNPS